MNEAQHAHFEGQLRDLFARGLSPEAQTVLRAHVRSCPRCERLYERYSEAERGLHGQTQAPLTRAALDRVASTLFVPETPPVTSRLRPLALGLSAASAILLAGVILKPTPVDTSGLHARGSAQAPTQPGVGLRALRLVRDGERVQVQDLGSGHAHLKVGDELVLLYVNLVGASTVQVYLHPAGQDPRLLVPRRPIERDVQDARLGAPIVVTEGWPAGLSHIEAEFEGQSGTVRRRIAVTRQDS